jgi:hypothetical protein
MRAIAEWHNIDRARFEAEVLPRYEPAILRGAVASWPAVRHGRTSPQALAAYLSARDNGSEVDAVMVPPDQDGRIFYDPSMAGFNYLRNRLPLSKVLEQVLRYAGFGQAPAVAVQSALISTCLPGFTDENVLGLLAPTVAPRIWLGTAITTPAHFDESNNIACVVAGRRRFTLFPPEQVGNLYIGPLDHAPTGTPISLVDFKSPDFERFPKFGDALAQAQSAELGPGDAIFMPSLWWHHVQSLERFNVLVNYWWRASVDGQALPPSALDCLLHSVLSLRALPPEQRRAWAAIFTHYVFDPDSAAADHIPVASRGILGPLTPELQQRFSVLLATRLGPNK